MSERPIDNMLETTMQKIKEMVNSDTIIGDAINLPNGAVAIPVSKVTYGFASGGSEMSNKKQDDKNLFGGGSGAGVTLSPVGFLTVIDGKVELLRIEPSNTTIDRVIDMIPSTIDKISSMLKKKEKGKDKLEDI